MPLQIKTNYHFRPILAFFELTEKEQKDLTDRYENIEESAFFRYKNYVYDLSDFTKPYQYSPFAAFSGYLSETLFSGILIRLSPCASAVQVFYFFS